MCRILPIVTLLFLLLSSNAQSQQTGRAFHVIDKVSVAEKAKVLKVHTPDYDTLQIYVQHVEKEESRYKPDDNFLVEQSDYVVWCYPELYSHPKHLMGDAKGQIYILESDGEIIFHSNESLSNYSTKIKNRVSTLSTTILGE